MDQSNTQLLRFQKLNQDAIIPSKGSKKAAGHDLHSTEDTVVKAKDKALIGTGLIVAVPTGSYGRVAPRSGLAWKNFIDVGAGVIDEDYRGECIYFSFNHIFLVKVILFNFGEKDFEVKKGDRIAQLIIEKIVETEVVEVRSMEETERGEGGFGSTGVEVKNNNENINSQDNGMKID
jgi:dUTP pyrophosphatase